MLFIQITFNTKNTRQHFYLDVQVDPIHKTFRSGNESDPNSGADDLREAVEPDDATLGVQRKETRSFLRHELKKRMTQNYFE